MCLRQKAASEAGKTGESPDDTQCPDLHRGRSTGECPSSYPLPATPLPAILPPFLRVLLLCLAVDFSAILPSDLPVVPSCLVGTSCHDGHTAQFLHYSLSKALRHASLERHFPSTDSPLNF